MEETQLVVIGGGNMGGALIRGLIAAGMASPGRVLVAEPDANLRDALSACGVGVFPDAAGAIRQGGAETTLLIAVKPQIFPAVALELGTSVGGRLVVSVMAGIRADTIRERLGGDCRVVRLMPNLAVTVRAGMTGIAPGAGATAQDIEWSKQLAMATGEWVLIKEEQLDTFTALAGSGPAYLFYLAEAMTRSGAELGIDGGVADRVVRQTLAGAARILAEGVERSAGEWRAAVTSRGGTTHAACEVLDSRGVAEAVVEAIRAGAARGAELSRGG